MSIVDGLATNFLFIKLESMTRVFVEKITGTRETTLDDINESIIRLTELEHKQLETSSTLENADRHISIALFKDHATVLNHLCYKFITIVIPQATVVVIRTSGLPDFTLTVQPNYYTLPFQDGDSIFLDTTATQTTVPCKIILSETAYGLVI